MTTITSSLATSAPEAIFVPIDLEASLGRIEDCAPRESQDDDMDCDGQGPPPPQPFHNTRTSSRTPFSQQSSETFSIAPYPISETDAEIRERQRWLMNESTGLGTVIQGLSSYPYYNDERSMMEVTATDSTLDDDDFSIEDDGSLAQEELERIEDPVSFWETTAVQQTEDSQQLAKENIVAAVSNEETGTSPSSSETSMEW
jgi:hypothetical protein